MEISTLDIPSTKIAISRFTEKFIGSVGKSTICLQIQIVSSRNSTNDGYDARLRDLQIHIFGRESVIEEGIISLIVSGFLKNETCGTTSILIPNVLTNSGTDFSIWTLPKIYSTANYSEITISGKVTLIRSVAKRPKLPPKLESSKIQTDFENLLTSGLESDAIVVAEDKEFKVHRNILSSRSPVFMRTFQTDMKEKQDGRLELDDVRSDVLDAMLKFIYTGRCKDFDKGDMVEQLYMVGHRYEMQDLMETAMSAMCSNIMIENVGRRILLAERYDITELRNLCFIFLGNHGKEMVDVPGPLFVL